MSISVLRHFIIFPPNRYCSIVSVNFKRVISNSLPHRPKTSVLEKKSGRQNEFYFERSKLLNGVENRDLYEKIPVVLLLGWAGTRDQYMRKYEQIYAQLGYHTIRFSPSNFLTLLQTRKHKSYADRLINLIDELKLKNNTFITHVFRLITKLN